MPIKSNNKNFVNYFSLLNVGLLDSKEEIKKNYYKLAHLHHPDKNNESTTVMGEINKASGVLSDDKERADYFFKNIENFNIHHKKMFVSKEKRYFMFYHIDHKDTGDGSPEDPFIAGHYITFKIPKYDFYLSCLKEKGRFEMVNKLILEIQNDN